MPRTTPILIAALDPSWRDDINYDVGNLKAYDGTIYQALQPSGPNTNGGVRRPDESPEYWEVFQKELMEYTAGDGIDVTETDGIAEIAVDDTVVRTSGNQTISGNKLFTSITTFTTDIFRDARTAFDSSADYIILSNENIVKGTVPATTSMTRFMFMDGTASAGTVPESKKLGSVEMLYNTDGSTVARLSAYQPVADSEERSSIAVVYPSADVPYAIAPATPATASSNEIVTVNYLKGANSGVVHTTGNENISGTKMFTDLCTSSDFMVDFSTLNVSSTSRDTPNMVCRTAYTKGEERVAEAIFGGFIVNDKANTELGSCTAAVFPSYVKTNLVANKNDPSVEVSPASSAELAVYNPNTGDPYAKAPTTPAAASSNEIVTVDYLKGANSGVVHTTGDETIEGTKTFIGNTVIQGDLQCLGYGGTDTFDIDIKDPTIIKGSNATGIKSTTITWHDGTYIEGESIDNTKVLGQLVFAYNTSGAEFDSNISLKPYRPVTGSSESAALEVHATPTEAYVLAPSTREIPADNEVITYDFLKKYVSEALSQVQTAKSE